MNSGPEKERICYHALRVALKNDYRQIEKSKSNFKTWEKALLSSEGLWSRAARGERSRSDPETEWEKLERAGIRLILAGDPEFPPLLREMPWPPFGVYIKGVLPRAETPTVAIVGTRKASEDGKELARRFGRELAEAGVAVISGLAFGIDSAGHRGCLEGNGATVAVLGNGLDEVYPKSNERLAKEILARGGALVSEYSPGTPSLPRHFLERNRLVSGLSSGVVLIEVPTVSGSLATARFALEQNREVFVVPGPAAHPNFSGSHQLIRNGARLVTSTSDVLEDLGLAHKSGLDARKSDFGTEEEKLIFELLEKSSGPIAVDDIIEITKLDSQTANQALSFLLIKNMIQEEGEGYMANK